ncbi:hypothetical protein ACIMS1_004481 [Vibrio harveyi]
MKFALESLIKRKNYKEKIEPQESQDPHAIELVKSIGPNGLPRYAGNLQTLCKLYCVSYSTSYHKQLCKHGVLSLLETDTPKNEYEFNKKYEYLGTRMMFTSHTTVVFFDDTFSEVLKLLGKDPYFRLNSDME